MRRRRKWKINEKMVVCRMEGEGGSIIVGGRVDR